MIKESLVGKRFDKLVVISQIKKTTKDKRRFWKCLCDCGNYNTVCTGDLNSSHSRSCGCVHKYTGSSSHIFKGFKELSLSHFNKINLGAKRRNLEFNLTIEYVYEILEKQNFKCAISLLDIEIPKTRNGIGTASLDRIDNTKGYVKGNVQWLHKDINKLKSDLKQEYFIELCKKVSNATG